MVWVVDGLARKPYPGERGKTGVESASGGYEYKDIFPEELPGLPPYKDLDFTIELHLGTSPISMTPHRMVPVEL